MKRSYILFFLACAGNAHPAGLYLRDFLQMKSWTEARPPVTRQEENLGNPRSDLASGSAQMPASQRVLPRGSIKEEGANLTQQMLVTAGVKAGDFLLKAESPFSDDRDFIFSRGAAYDAFGDSLLSSEEGFFPLQQVPTAETIGENASEGLVSPLITTVILRSFQGIFVHSAEKTDSSSSESSNASEIIRHDRCDTPHPRIFGQQLTQIPRSPSFLQENSRRPLIPHPPQYAPRAHSADECDSSTAIKENSQSESSKILEVQTPCTPLPPEILVQQQTESSSASVSQETHRPLTPSSPQETHRPLTPSSPQDALSAHSAVQDDLLSCGENTHLYQQVSVTEFGQIIRPLSEGLNSSQTTLTPSIPQGSSRGNPRHLIGPRKSTLSNLGSGTFESLDGQTASLQLLSPSSESETLLQLSNQNATSSHNQAPHSLLKTYNGSSNSYQLSNSTYQEETETMTTVMQQKSDSLRAGATGESLVEFVDSESQPVQTSKREQDSASMRIGTAACTPKAASTEGTESLSSDTAVSDPSLTYRLRLIGTSHQNSVDSSSSNPSAAKGPDTGRDLDSSEPDELDTPKERLQRIANSVMRHVKSTPIS